MLTVLSTTNVPDHNPTQMFMGSIREYESQAIQFTMWLSCGCFTQPRTTCRAMHSFTADYYSFTFLYASPAFATKMLQFAVKPYGFFTAMMQQPQHTVWIYPKITIHSAWFKWSCFHLNCHNDRCKVSWTLKNRHWAIRLGTQTLLYFHTTDRSHSNKKQDVLGV